MLLSYYSYGHDFAVRVSDGVSEDLFANEDPKAVMKDCTMTEIRISSFG
jgi:hypothetical protein